MALDLKRTCGTTSRIANGSAYRRSTARFSGRQAPETRLEAANRVSASRLRRTGTGQPGKARRPLTSVLLFEIAHVGRRYELEGNIDLLLDLFALGEFQRRVYGAFSLPSRILEHGYLE